MCSASVWILVNIAYAMDRLKSMTEGYVVLLRVRAPNGTLVSAVSLRVEDYMLWTLLPIIEGLVVVVMFSVGLLVYFLREKFRDEFLGKKEDSKK